MTSLTRLLQPKSIAVLGGGAWCKQIIQQAQKMGFSGEIWPIHPLANTICDLLVYKSIDDLPSSPDATFIGINRHATIDAVAKLREISAGGAVCFASGFSEAAAEDESGTDLQARLLEAAGSMPILGPNCYGFINAVDKALLWPDQHGCVTVDKGVAIITQSSNIAINLTMQQRGLPIAYVVTCGNMAQTTQAKIATSLLDDERVTAIGMHIEGFTNLDEWQALARKAKSKNIPLIALKVGKSTQAQAATISHTASMAGADVGADALLNRLSIARVHDLPTFLETLKLLHFVGPLASSNIASISCSGGEASLAADTAHGRNVFFPPLNDKQRANLRSALGPKVALANPLDYHTYIWRDTDAMTRAFSAITDPNISLTILIVDYPKTDASDWECATQAALRTRRETGTNVAVVATLPELMPEDVASRLAQGGVIPMNGLTEAIAAIEAASFKGQVESAPILLPGLPRDGIIKTELEAKLALAKFGVKIPNHNYFNSFAQLEQTTITLKEPLVLKGVGIAHKTEAGAVMVNISKEELVSASKKMPTQEFFVEEIITGPIAELLIGVTRDPAHGFCLTIAAGGVLTELLCDNVTVLIPSSRDEIRTAMSKLRVNKLLEGYRGGQGANIPAILDAIEAVQSYVMANSDLVEEVEINPLICTQTGAFAADALIKEV